MEGDLEDELRLAMAEQVRDVEAPLSLAAEVRRGYHRRVRRRRVISIAALFGGLIVAVPAYSAIAPHHPKNGVRPRDHWARSAGPTPSAVDTGPVPRPKGRGMPRRPEGPSRSSARSASAGPQTILGVILGYAPVGIRLDGSCPNDLRPMLTCRWNGADGQAIDITVVRSPVLLVPADLHVSVPVPRLIQVHGQQAILGDVLSGGSEVIWIERRGVGVIVSVTSTLRGNLTQIAEGLHIAG